MIKRFFAKNFSSIKERMDISFEASKMEDDTFYNNVFRFRDTDILKVSAFYGMNASGKSRIVMALAALRELVIPPQMGPKTPYIPFKFDEQTKTAPIELGIEFSLNNDEGSSVYKYFVLYNEKVILNERLEKMTSQKPSLLFERFTSDNEVTSIRLGATVQNNPLLSAIKDSVVPHRTFLSMFNQFRVEDFYNAYLFFFLLLLYILLIPRLE